MASQQVTVQCTGCNKALKRSVEEMAPECFSSGQEPVLKSGFWCPHCNTYLFVKYEFSRNKDNCITISVKEHMTPPSNWIPKPGAHGITVRHRQKRPTRSS